MLGGACWVGLLLCVIANLRADHQHHVAVSGAWTGRRGVAWGVGGGLICRGGRG